MSCCCNSLYTGIPCCCPPYTTTTTTFPICEDGEQCSEKYTTDCVVYDGPTISLPCLTIQSGDRYTEILEAIIANLSDCEPFVPTTTTTQGPQVLVPICLSYSPIGGCAAACGLDCSTYYAYTDCYNSIMANNPFEILDCVLYTDSDGLIPAPTGFYSKQGALCLILGSGSNNGEITGVTNCP